MTGITLKKNQKECPKSAQVKEFLASDFCTKLFLKSPAIAETHRKCGLALTIRYLTGCPLSLLSVQPLADTDDYDAIIRHSRMMNLRTTYQNYIAKTI